jgi:hypothetical protein
MATMILVVAIVLLIGTFMVRSWAFEATDHGSYTEYALSRDGRAVASWTDLSYSIFSCPPRP